MDYPEKKEPEKISADEVKIPEKKSGTVDCIRPDLHHSRNSEKKGDEKGVIVKGTARY